ncbi:class I mannose-6-phosphate isomerase [Aureitalea sp. L0-47]|nr:class I mannose-6-phosphate isomerase [Aureitalea sp. L0-47]
MKSYPIKFNPILKEKIWGGTKLINEYNKGNSHSPIGESWEISGVEGNISTVMNGAYKGMTLNELQSRFTSDFLGDENYSRFGQDFPLLIKFLDASKDLSIQVHPDDELARSRHGGYGKTEMWYVMDHEKDASVIMGSRDEHTALPVSGFDATSVDSFFKREKVQNGDIYSIPAGMVHALGAGVMVAEIQQTSDITYRIFDWNRKDSEGKKRDLHIDLAQEAIKDFSSTKRISYKASPNTMTKTVSNEFFTTNMVDVHSKYKRDLAEVNSFVIYMCVEGRTSITVDNHTEILQAGETVLLPANSSEAAFYGPKARLLEVYVDPAMHAYMEAAA